MKILTFDIEEWWAYDRYGIGNPEDYQPRLGRYLEAVLDALDDKGFQATFFCLGAMAETYPEPVKRIAARGHQIGCHSYSHSFFANATYQEFVEDTRRALGVLEDILGRKVTAYRAPAFSLTQNNAWMVEALVSLGIACDSSLFPARRSYGGIEGFACKEPCVLTYQGVALKEFPISTTRIAGREIAYAGGGYFRMLPYRLIKRATAGSNYVMSYFHLMDFDRDQKRHFRSFEGENAIVRYFKNYFGLNGAFAKFQKLIDDCEFISMYAADQQLDWNAAATIKMD